MKRRDLLSNSVAAFVSGCLPAIAQTPLKRVAIVIGVDKCKDESFPTLSGASAGALEIKDWLEREKYDSVVSFVDEGGINAVRIGDISKAIKEFVGKDTVEQLVIYFAGHGFYQGDEEVWMLSESPETPYEAIGLNSTARLAKRSGIRHITIISDACRSPAKTLSLQNVTPIPVFPNRESPAAPGKIDKFFATQTGTAAAEAKIGESLKYQGLFTKTFLAAFRSPIPDMVKTFPDGTKVVPNRRLENFLTSEVPKLAQSIDFNLKQTPECDVPSEDDFYIARVAPGATISGETIEPKIPSRNDINSSEFGKQFTKLGTQIPNFVSDLAQVNIDKAVKSTGFETIKQEVIDSFDAAKIWRQFGNASTGFVIVRKRVLEVAVHPGNRATLNTVGDQTLVFIEIGNGKTACSVAVRFDDGTGTVLAALKDYVGTVATSTVAVTNVGYDPEYAVGEPEVYIAGLRATTAAAFKSGVLRFQGSQKEREQQAEQFGDIARRGKSIDPSLGVYAAYAFDEASLPEKVSSVRLYMADGLRADIFDVAMLDGKWAANGAAPKDIVPFCPVLGIGWSYLNSSNVELPEVVSNAKRYLMSSPWTAFEKEGMDLLITALREGILS
jgi:hypothetical protein